MLGAFAVPLGLLWVVVCWLASSIAVGAAAYARGRSKAKWVALALLLGPVVTPLLLLCYPTR